MNKQKREVYALESLMQFSEEIEQNPNQLQAGKIIIDGYYSKGFDSISAWNKIIKENKDLENLKNIDVNLPRTNKLQILSSIRKVATPQQQLKQKQFDSSPTQKIQQFSPYKPKSYLKAQLDNQLMNSSYLLNSTFHSRHKTQNDEFDSKMRFLLYHPTVATERLKDYRIQRTIPAYLLDNKSDSIEKVYNRVIHVRKNILQQKNINSSRQGQRANKNSHLVKKAYNYHSIVRQHKQLGSYNPRLKTEFQFIKPYSLRYDQDMSNMVTVLPIIHQKYVRPYQSLQQSIPV